MHINAQIVSCVLLNVSLLYSIICVCLGVVVALRIQIVVLDEAIIVVYRFRQGASTVGRALSRTSSSSLFRDSIAGIDPVGIHIDGSREIYSGSQHRRHKQGKDPLTVDITLERLSTDLTHQIADTGLLLDSHGDGVLVVAEEALKRRWQLLLLV